MNDPRLELFERLARTLASLEATFASLAIPHVPPASAPPAAATGSVPAAARPAPHGAGAAAGTLAAAEQDRLVRQLRVLREEVKALGDALAHASPHTGESHEGPPDGR